MSRLSYVCMLLLVLCSAFFSSSEIAYATANKLRMRKAAEGGSRQAVSAVWISEHFPSFLSTILVGNNLVNIAFSSCMTVALTAAMGSRGESLAPIYSTVVLLVGGEILPKLVGASQANRLVYLYTWPLRFFMLLFSPVVKLVSAIVGRLSRLWTPEDPEPEVTDDELVTILETIEEEGVFTEQESELIKSAIEFSDVTAMDIYLPRVDVAAFDADDPIDTILRDPDLLSYSRIPVYRESIDNILGILSTKKLLKAAASMPVEQVRLEELLSPVVYVHKTRPISSILMEFRRKHLMMAVVVDEFGGTMGILTLEDILEEIVGDIFDESDDVEQEVVEAAENVFTVDGSTNIYDFFDRAGYEPAAFESEYTTMGGLAIEKLDRFPKAGDHFVWDRFDITVTAAEAMRVETLEIRLLPEKDEAE